ncbi:24357_t:CDS:2 [Cetraspora pellucida]|uniref:ATP-dependent DNA helicase n=1 Tax=Cetraspora pellucida TaxID=1433469 RepID=A0A9N9AFJ4_9GLOM|nr:24357_t:CDS:2 [Cetraspora pellucida]
MFGIVNSDGKITAINLRIDYMYCGKQLKNMCLYDYAATIHKVKINDKELNKLTRQGSREGRTTRVDRFYFLGGNQQCDETSNNRIKHPQHSMHIQVHWSHGNERIPVLYGKGIPCKDDLENIERYKICILLLFKPWTSSYNLLEEYGSWHEAYLLQNRSVVGYDTSTDDIEIMNNLEDFNNGSISSFNPYTIIHSGFRNSKLVDEAIPAYENDDKLIQKWQEIISDKPSQLLIHLSGAGGTGKSKVIRAICKFFDLIGQKRLLAVCASTGFAASCIGGHTLHLLCSFKFGENEDFKYHYSKGKSTKTLQDQWADIEYLILDEISMVGQKLLMQFHAHIKEAKPY